MDATCAIQASIHVFSLVRKYVSRILGTYQSGWTGRDFFDEKNNTIKHLQYTLMGYIMSLQMRNRNRLAGK